MVRMGSEPGTMAARDSRSPEATDRPSFNMTADTGLVHGHDEHEADETTMLENTNLFRLISS